MTSSLRGRHNVEQGGPPLVATCVIREYLRYNMGIDVLSDFF